MSDEYEFEEIMAVKFVSNKFSVSKTNANHLVPNTNSVL